MFSPLTVFALTIIAALFVYGCFSLKEKLAAYSVIGFSAVCMIMAIPPYLDLIKNF
jgi:uncharacterized membrane protein YuzA (DUF378 family)